MNKKQKLIFKLPRTSISYPIEILPGSLSNPVFLAHELPTLGARFAIITDSCVNQLYGLELKNSLSKSGLETFLFVFPQGEEHKTRKTKEDIENQLFENQLGRDTCIIALGGGVSIDLAGFLASTYCRGVPLVMIPTSLLAMVDASLGGKTGVDVAYGKNLIGSIYQPKMVLIDPLLLKTLPLKQLRNGIVEMIKHGLIADSNYFSYLSKHAEQILNLNSQVMSKVIFQSCKIKKKIVEQDEKEGGIRNLLNCGHTIGHALEYLTDFSLNHGEAVAIGLLVESQMAMQLGYIDQTTTRSIYEILKKFGLALKIPKSFSIEQLLNAMILDKKSLKGKPRFVMLNAIGSALPCKGAYCMAVQDEILIDALTWMNKNLAV